MLFFFLQYFFEYLQLSGREKQLCSVGAFSMTGLLLLLTLASPWTGAALTVDEDGLQMGPWFPLLQGVVLLCYLFVTIVILRHRSVLRRREFVFLLLYILIPLAGGLSRIVLPNIVLVNAGFTVATLLILMNAIFGLYGIIWTQLVVELLMLPVSLGMYAHTFRRLPQPYKQL